MESKLRTLEVKPSKSTMIKAGELVDVVEVTPLTLTDRKIYNLLIDNAKQNIAKPIEHSVEKERLRLSRRGNERVDDTINRLMGAVAKIKTLRNGEPAILRVQLLGRNIEHERDDGKFYYTFDPVLREVFSDSTVFAKLKMDVMLNFQGKYGLALYEMAEKRINLRKNEEIFSIAEFRSLLGVPKGKLTTWNNLKTKAFDPAVEEVNQLAVDFRVEVEGIKSGRSFAEVKLKWWRKAPDGQDAAVRELDSPKIGRKARRQNSIEMLTMMPSPKKPLRVLVSEKAQEKASEILVGGSNRWSILDAMDEWEFQFHDKDYPENPDAAFISFCKKISALPQSLKKDNRDFISIAELLSNDDQ